jgi:uncharacterized protein YkwD
MQRHWHQLRPRHQKPSPLIALGIMFLCLYISNYINSLQGKSLQPNSVSNISDTQSPQSINSMEQSVYEQINEHRESKGLPPLVLDGWLSQHAREQSIAMARGEISINDQTVQSRYQEIIDTGPYKRVDSMVCVTFGHTLPGRAAVNSWLSDPQERFISEIYGNYELTGVGVAMNLKGEYYFTQIFLLR